MTPFTLRLPAEILFGRDSRFAARDAILGLGRKVVLVRGRSVAWVNDLARDLGIAGLDVIQITSGGEPDLRQLDDALTRAKPFAPDVVVAAGGGATLDLGKAIAGLIRSPHPPMTHFEVVGEGRPIDTDTCPFIAIPTTSGTGAEATKNAVITLPDHGLKVSLRDDRMLARLAIVDPALTDNSPRGLTLASGLDAITQLIEPYLSSRANPLTDSLCADMIPRALTALHQLMHTESAEARDTMARASLTSGVALANSGLGIVHGLAGVIGGGTGAPHGALCGRLLPASLSVNMAAMRAANLSTARLDRVTDWVSDVLQGDTLATFMDGNGLPNLRAMGCTPDQHADIALAAMNASSTKGNPVPLSQAQIVQILERTT